MKPAVFFTGRLHFDFLIYRKQMKLKSATKSTFIFIDCNKNKSNKNTYLRKIQNSSRVTPFTAVNDSLALFFFVVKGFLKIFKKTKLHKGVAKIATPLWFCYYSISSVRTSIFFSSSLGRISLRIPFL